MSTEGERLLGLRLAEAVLSFDVVFWELGADGFPEGSLGLD